LAKSKIFEGRQNTFSYLNDRQQFGYAVSSELCQLKAAEIAKEIGI
jgi:hypothetical protein